MMAEYSFWIWWDNENGYPSSCPFYIECTCCMVSGNHPNVIMSGRDKLYVKTESQVVQGKLSQDLFSHCIRLVFPMG